MYDQDGEYYPEPDGFWQCDGCGGYFPNKYDKMHDSINNLVYCLKCLPATK